MNFDLLNLPPETINSYQFSSIDARGFSKLGESTN